MYNVKSQAWEYVPSPPHMNHIQSSAIAYIAWLNCLCCMSVYIHVYAMYLFICCVLLYLIILITKFHTQFQLQITYKLINNILIRCNFVHRCDLMHFIVKLHLWPLLSSHDLFHYYFVKQKIHKIFHCNKVQR